MDVAAVTAEVNRELRKTRDLFSSHRDNVDFLFGVYASIIADDTLAGIDPTSSSKNRYRILRAMHWRLFRVNMAKIS